MTTINFTIVEHYVPNAHTTVFFVEQTVDLIGPNPNSVYRKQTENGYKMCYDVPKPYINCVGAFYIHIPDGRAYGMLCHKDVELGHAGKIEDLLKMMCKKNGNDCVVWNF